MHLLIMLLMLIGYAGWSILNGVANSFNGTNDEIRERATKNGDIVYHIGDKTYLTKDCYPVKYYNYGNGDWGYKYLNGKIAYSKQAEIQKKQLALTQAWRTTYLCTDPNVREKYLPYEGNVFRDLRTGEDFLIRSVRCYQLDPKTGKTLPHGGKESVACYFDAITHRIVRLSDGEINHQAWLKKYKVKGWYPDAEQIQQKIDDFNKSMDEKENGDIYHPDYIWVRRYGEKEYYYPSDKSEVNHPFHKSEEIEEAVNE